MLYCLDTNIIIDIFRGDDTLKTRLIELSNIHTFSITPIALSELFRGAYLAQNQQEMLALIENFIQGVALLSFDTNTCKLYGQKYSELKKHGKLTSEFDLMIGCIALAHNAVLITRNPRDFANITGLSVISL